MKTTALPHFLRHLRQNGGSRCTCGLATEQRPAKPTLAFLAWAVSVGLDVYQPYGHLQCRITAAAWSAWQAAKQDS